MNNIKRLFLGIAAIALTLSFSAFKEVRTEAKSSKFATVYYGWNETDQQYDRIFGTPDPDLNCDLVAPEICTIEVETENPSPPAHLTLQQAQDADATEYDNSGPGSYFND